MDPTNIIAYAISSVLLLLGIVLIIKSIQLKIDIVLLILVIIFGAVGNLMAISSGIIFAQVGSMLLGLSFIFLYFHYESIASRKPNMIITSFLLMMYAIVIGFNILLIVYLLDNPTILEIANQNTRNFFFYLDELAYKIALAGQYYLVSIIALTSFIRSLIVILQAYRLSKSKPALVDSIGLVFLIIYRILFLPRYFIPMNPSMLISTIGLGFSVIGLLMILINYVINSDYLYLLPFPIHSFMIYNKHGLLCYSRKIKQLQPEMEEQDYLITGAFSAITNLIEENLGGNAKIKHINAQQYQIFFNPLPNDSGTLVVIAYGETALFIRSLRRFIQNISTKLLTLINSSVISTDLGLKIDELIQKSYPYVNFAKK